MTPKEDKHDAHSHDQVVPSSWQRGGPIRLASDSVIEAIGLDCCDLRTDTSSLTIRRGKNGRSREIPIHETTLHALLAYRGDVERAFPRLASPSLLVSIRGTRLCQSAVNPTFRTILDKAGLQPHGTRCSPRLHDARHLADAGVMRPA